MSKPRDTVFKRINRTIAMRVRATTQDEADRLQARINKQLVHCRKIGADAPYPRGKRNDH